MALSLEQLQDFLINIGFNSEIKDNLLTVSLVEPQEDPQTETKTETKTENLKKSITPNSQTQTKTNQDLMFSESFLDTLSIKDYIMFFDRRAEFSGSETTMSVSLGMISPLRMKMLIDSIFVKKYEVEVIDRTTIKLVKLNAPKEQTYNLQGDFLKQEGLKKAFRKIRKKIPESKFYSNITNKTFKIFIPESKIDTCVSLIPDSVLDGYSVSVFENYLTISD